jgi:hypothetical protein
VRRSSALPRGRSVICGQLDNVIPSTAVERLRDQDGGLEGVPGRWGCTDPELLGERLDTASRLLDGVAENRVGMVEASGTSG